MSRQTFYRYLFMIVLLVGFIGCGVEKPASELDDDQLIKRLESSDPVSRHSAADELGRRKVKAAVPMLKRVLVEDDIAFVRSSAATALGWIEDKSSVPVLIKALNEDNDGSVRFFSAWALGKIKDKSAVQVLIKAVEKDEDKHVRQMASVSLGMIKDKSSVPALIKALVEDNDKRVRYFVAKALGTIKDKSAVPVLIKTLVEDNDGPVRSHAAWALGEIKNKSAVSVLKNAVEKDKNEVVRASAAWALGKIKAKSAVSVLKKAVEKDKDKDVRASAAEALGEIKDISSIPVLIKTLYDLEDNTDVWKALNEITGQHFGDDPAEWREWWNKNKTRILKEEAEKENSPDHTKKIIPGRKAIDPNRSTNCLAINTSNKTWTVSLSLKKKDMAVVRATNKINGKEIIFQNISAMKNMINTIEEAEWIAEDRVFLKCHVNPSLGMFVVVDLSKQSLAFYDGSLALWNPKRDKLARLKAPPHFGSPANLGATISINNTKVADIEKNDFKSMFWSADGKRLLINLNSGVCLIEFISADKFNSEKFIKSNR